ncbi:hypothetical protein SDC9_124404 [bioreactor metagenome]|uniref:Uncharacterized protein n=1 Tax=bioreactor metagenome TaxID=1076179 RepID=A0A645CKB6_9ZZZZ
MTADSAGVTDIMSALQLSKASVYSCLPYKEIAFNLPEEQRSSNADRHRVYRKRKKAVEALNAAPTSLNLWKAIIVFEGYPFTTSGRGSREGVRFKYRVTTGGPSGKQYSGDSVEGYGNEILIEDHGKSIILSSVDYALKIALEGEVTGPKQLKIYRCGFIH